MEVKDLKLDEISFSQPPTRTQIVNMLRDIHRFLSRVGGCVIQSEEFTVADQAVGAMLNATIQIKAASDVFEAGPSQQGLVHAMPAPSAQMRPQQVR